MTPITRIEICYINNDPKYAEVSQTRNTKLEQVLWVNSLHYDRHVTQAINDSHHEISCTFKIHPKSNKCIGYTINSNRDRSSSRETIQLCPFFSWPLSFVTGIVIPVTQIYHTVTVIARGWGHRLRNSLQAERCQRLLLYILHWCDSKCPINATHTTLTVSQK